MDAIAVSALYVHPIKSCRGHAVDRATLDNRGFVGDRRLLVTDPNGRFLTQRDTPRLALVTPRYNGTELQLEAPETNPLDVSAAAQSVAREIVIWNDTVRANDLGDEAAAWLTAFLERPVRLVVIGPEFARPVRRGGPQAGDEVSFADAHPLLIIGEASLADLNARLDEPLPMNRFRPNIVVRGAKPFAEDTWKRIRIGRVVLRASGPCARCVMTTTDQNTLERGKEPLRTLALYRRGNGSDVNFGQNYINESKAGTIAVGDVVEILE